jgi:CBS domain-containing protein
VAASNPAAKAFRRIDRQQKSRRRGQAPGSIRIFRPRDPRVHRVVINLNRPISERAVGPIPIGSASAYLPDMKVHEIMTIRPRSIAPENTLIEAAGLMRELDVGALPVWDNNELAGMLTDRDLVVRGIADGRDPSQATVADVMSGGVEFVFGDQEVEEAVQIMEQHQIRRVPVLDRGKRLIGIVSLGDIATSSNPAFSGLALRDVSEPRDPSSRQRRLSRESEPARMPRAPGGRRSPGEDRRTGGKRTPRARTKSKSTGRGQKTRATSGKRKVTGKRKSRRAHASR